MGKKSREKRLRRERQANAERNPPEVSSVAPPPASVSAEPPDRPVTVTDASFQREVIESDVPVLVDFWASWCAPCRMIAPALEALAAEFRGQAKIAKVDTEQNPRITDILNVRSLPTLMLYKNGNVVDMQVGAAPKAQLESMLKKHITVECAAAIQPSAG